VRKLLILTTAILTLPSLAWGMEPVPGLEGLDALSGGGDSKSVGVGVGFGQMDEDWFLKTQLMTEINLGKFGLGIRVPLNIRVKDNDPTADGDLGGVIRKEDWDEPVEYLRVIRYLRWGHKGDPVYVRIGELAARIGHGTIMDRYMNNLDLNTFRLGLQLDVNTKWGGVETVVADTGRMFSDSDSASKIAGGRIYVKPYAFVDPDGFLNIFSVGTSLVMDSNAPLTLEADASGELKVKDTVSASVYGFDMDVAALRSPVFDITPYTDLNFLSDADGWGWHAGVNFLAKLPVGIALNIPFRVEYRRFFSGYRPVYFGNYYEAERYGYSDLDKDKADPVTGEKPMALAGTKASVLRELSDGLNGYYADAFFDFAGLVRLGGVYEDYEGMDPNLAILIDIPALQVVQFRGYYTRMRIEGTDDIFALDERSLLIAEGRYEIFPMVYAVGRWSRTWARDEKGEIGEMDSWDMGVEASISF